MAELLGETVACDYGCTKNSFYLPLVDRVVQGGWDASPDIKVGGKCWVYRLELGTIYAAASKLTGDVVEFEAEAVHTSAMKRHETNLLNRR